MREFKLNNIPVEIDFESILILNALNKASRALGELKGIIGVLPYYQLVLNTIVLQEAKDSNEVENIITTNDELYQAKIDNDNINQASKEAYNYFDALMFGCETVKKDNLITLNTLKKIQNLISPNHPIRKLPGTVLKNPISNEVVYTPPQNYEEIVKLLANLEVYINDQNCHSIDPLIKMCIIHYQFESIHPFYDGNGRTGRILNILYLVQQGLLDQPALYLSNYIIKNKAEYYQLLQNIRTDNQWDDWIIWMLNGVEQTALTTISIIRDIKELMDKYDNVIKQEHSFYSHELVSLLFKYPYTKIEFIQSELNVHRNTASHYLNSLASGEVPILKKIKKGYHYYFVNYKLLELF